METISTKTARRKFRAWRDEQGVPHVDARSWIEAIYALGYLHAVDRPTQILFGRAVAEGRGSERIADTPELRETDRFFRRAALFRNVQTESRGLADSAFDQITAYCEGINDGMQQAGRTLPMWATGFHPEPWNHQAVLLIGNLLAYGGLAVSQLRNERLMLDLIRLGVDRSRMQELFAPHLDGADFDLLEQVNLPSQLSDEAIELIADLPRLAGSNAWAVAPERSATGSALLASDPHLEINRLPAIWYEACLKWDDHYVMGATLPGCPLFAVARTRDLAWGVTYMKGDTCDQFIEDCRPGGETGWQYRRGEAWHDFDVRHETIGRPGTEPETLDVFENDLGTLEGDPVENSPGLYLSDTWTGRYGGDARSISTWLELIPCPGVEAAVDIVRHCPHPSLVWVFADRAGHIGKQACGNFPRRQEGHGGLVPVPAWDEANHWQGRLDVDVLPRVVDPPEGFVASANENINPEGGPRLITLTLPDYRKRRIVERLREMPAATVEEMQQLQYDVISLQARDLLSIFMPHLPDGPLKQRLSAWDCNYAPESVEATLFQQLYVNVLLEIFGHEKGIGWRRMLYVCTRAGYSTLVLTCIDRLLRKEQALWWEHRIKGELIKKAALRVDVEAAQPWSHVNAFHFVNRFFEGHRVGHVLGFHTAEMPMPGCHATPFQGHVLSTATRETTFAPSYHMVTDLGTDEAWTNLPGGPSESRFSKHYKNDIPLWQAGDYKRLAADDAVEEDE